jgi:glycosyltransferase involved in cell wall biosynthesis
VKNLENVIAAMSLLQATSPDIQLRVVGAKAGSFAEMTLDLPASVKNNVHFLGQVDDTQTLISLYRGATALIFPSFYEASPLPPLEAMSCGCPVIASDIPALKERCGDAALYCDPTDPQSIANSINQILSSPVLQKELREKGMQHARQFSWQKCAIETITVLRKMMP